MTRAGSRGNPAGSGPGADQVGTGLSDPVCEGIWPRQRLPGDSEPGRIRFCRLTGDSIMNRRDFLWQSGGGLGGIALASLLGAEQLLAGGEKLR